MSVWLIVGIVLAVLLIGGGVIFWRTARTGDTQVSRLEIDAAAGSAARLRTTSVEGRADLFRVEVTNVGEVATTIQDIYLEVTGGWRLKMNSSFKGRPLLRGDRPFPCRLDPGETVSYGIPGDSLRRQLADMNVQLADEPVALQVIDVQQRIYQIMLPVEQLSR